MGGLKVVWFGGFQSNSETTYSGYCVGQNGCCCFCDAPHRYADMFLESRKLSESPFLIFVATRLLGLAGEEQKHCVAKCALASVERVSTSEAPHRAPFVVVLKKASLSARNSIARLNTIPFLILCSRTHFLTGRQQNHFTCDTGVVNHCIRSLDMTRSNSRKLVGYEFNKKGILGNNFQSVFGHKFSVIGEEKRP